MRLCLIDTWPHLIQFFDIYSIPGLNPDPILKGASKELGPPRSKNWALPQGGGINNSTVQVI